MSGTSSAPPLQLDSAVFGGTSPSALNSCRITAIVERLAMYLRSGNLNQYSAVELYNQFLSLSRGIDYALANGEVPLKAKDLPSLMKQLCQQKSDELSQAALMVLMISVKNACKFGWFQAKETEELLTIADEMGKIYCSMGNINAGLSSCHSTIPTIMERFYPKMNLGPILVSIDAKPGYGAYTVDFHITKSTVQQDKIWLLVAQTDNLETSACLINPQQVNFLLNGRGVERRTNVFMDTGPQMPSVVSGMLKFGTNLLQAVGHFSGHYVILVAYMSFRSLPEPPVLQDYVQPAVTSVDSDVIEGPSQISLNCPISFARIKTPVKGHSCKHFQCFDFDNYINMNSRRPSWRCPHCNQHVCYTDIRLDRNMVEVLKDVGENIVEVIVLADGSWKAVLDSDHNVDKTQNKAPNCEKEPTEVQEPSCSPSTVPNVLDLTNDDDLMEIMDTFETADRKPFPASVHTQFVTPNSTSLGVNSIGGNQNVPAHINDSFWSGLDLAFGRSDTPTFGVSENPVLLDTVSPAFNQEAEGHDNNTIVNPVMHNQVSAPSYMNSAVNEYGRSPSIQRHINRTPVAVQALPVPSPTLGPQQNLRTNLNSLLPSSSTATHVSSSNTATSDGFNAILSDTERQQHFSRSPINVPRASSVNSSVLQHHSATQNRGAPANASAPSPLSNPNRQSGSFSEFTNPHLKLALGSRAHPVRPPVSVQNQRGNTGGTSQSVSRTDDLFNLQLEENGRPRMRGSISGRQCSEEVRRQIIAPTQPAQNSRPQGSQPVQGSRPQGPLPGPGSRPQGPLPGPSSRPGGPPLGPGSGPQGQQLGQGSRPQRPQLLQSSRPQGPLPLRPTSVSPRLDVLIANNRNAHNHSPNT